MKIKRLCLILLVVAASLSAAFGVSRLVTPVSASSVEFTSDAIKDSALKNSVLNLPESVSVEFNEGTYTANDGVVVRPDGKTVAAGAITLDQTGVYVVKYFFSIGGVTHTAYKNVNVHSDYYELQNGGGSKVEKTTDENKLSSGKSGITVSLADGATFAYSKAVDLSKVDDYGLAEVIEFDNRSFHATVEKPETNDDYLLDCKEIWVRLTDCYNPNIYAELVLGRWAVYSGGVYSGVRTYCQSLTGLDLGIDNNPSSVDVNIDGVDYSLWPNDVGHMAMGSSYMSNDRTSGYICQYDYAQKRFYLSYTTGSGNTLSTTKRLVTDLDDPQCQQETGIMFPGWTTGEVILSVYGVEYGSGKAVVEINSIGGEELYDIIDTEYADDVLPNITIDAVKTTLTGVYAAVGDTVTLPSALVTDVNLVGGVDVAVYRAYGTTSQAGVSVKNGTFKIDKKDLYTVEYSARDSYGNVATELFTFNAVEVEGGKAIVLGYEKPESLTAGVPVILDAVVTNNLNGSVNDVDVEIIVESARQSEKFGATATLVPLYAEDYTVTYVYGDGIYSYEDSYTVSCTVDESIVSFYGDVQLPSYYLKGSYYAIDAAKAYNYVGGAPNPIAVTTYAVFDGDAENKVPVENVNKVLISGSSSVYFVYEAEGADPVSSKTVPIIDATTSSGKIDASKLFVGDFEKLDDTTSLKLKTTKTSGDAKMTYFNPISPKFFALNYKILIDEANFGTLLLTLEDSLDSSVKLTISLYKDGKNSYASINGGTSVPLTDFEFVNNFISISYTYSTRKISIGSYNDILETDFPSGSVYFSIEMLDLTDVSCIEIANLNNQPFTAEISKDETNPEIYVTGFYGYYGVGSIVKTAIPEFNDVLSDIDPTSVTMTISAKDGKPVYDKNGNVLSSTALDCTKVYEIKLDRIVRYFVSYSVSDLAGNNAVTSITVNCVDSTAPVITLDNISEGGTIHIKVCGMVNINFTVSDDVTLPEDIVTYVHLYCEDLCSFVGNITDISNESEDRPEDGVYNASFQIHVKGNYEAQIHCYDEQGNHSVTRIAIVVE